MKPCISSFATRSSWGLQTGELREGDALPSVRQLADHISINMHTVNKAYSVLRQEGFVKLDPEKGCSGVP